MRSFYRKRAALLKKIEEEKNMKKALALLLSMVMVLSLAACGGGGGGGGGKTSLNVIISQYGNYTQEWWNQFEKDFEAANDTVDLNIEIVSWNDIYSVVSTRFHSKQ